MKIVRKKEFSDWLDALRDRAGRARILTRLDRIADSGNFGDHHSVGGGVSELRIDYGPGYRVYYTIKNGTVIILLCGGDKDDQAANIRQAKRLLTV